MDFIVKNAEKTDIEQIGRLWIEFFDFHRQFDDHFSRSSDGHTNFMKFIESSIEDNNSLVLVAAINEQVVGYCLAKIDSFPPVIDDRDYGAIYDLAVTEKMRRKGCGEKLVEAARSWFKSKGMKIMQANVSVENPVSTAFWKKMGLRPVTVRCIVNI
ncbi:GNAT family N-acetyltransferase [Myxococcota bacterium]|nr:GNAT family N-acetyltransferase [Myxococcota bacterium]MBU1379493.1 GNAT family N-acetyltransferase [Myxococcota bacterium]MBU1497910.1 GNAT family N-acetyltransferase [Myxococcota bacterium]